jgi:hypothetical protein
MLFVLVFCKHVMSPEGISPQLLLCKVLLCAADAGSIDTSVSQQQPHSG